MYRADDRADWDGLICFCLFQDPHACLLVSLGSPGKMLDVRKVINVTPVSELKKQL